MLSDIYFHTFQEGKGLHKGFARDLFEINRNNDKIKQMFDAIELAKSILFTYASLLLHIKTSLEKGSRSFKLPSIPLYNIYPKLIWAPSNIVRLLCNFNLDIVIKGTIVTVTITLNHIETVPIQYDYKDCKNIQFIKEKQGKQVEHNKYLLKCDEIPMASIAELEIPKQRKVIDSITAKKTNKYPIKSPLQDVCPTALEELILQNKLTDITRNNVHRAYYRTGEGEQIVESVTFELLPDLVAEFPALSNNKNYYFNKYMKYKLKYFNIKTAGHNS